MSAHDMHAQISTSVTRVFGPQIINQSSSVWLINTQISRQQLNKQLF